MDLWATVAHTYSLIHTSIARVYFSIESAAIYPIICPY